MRRKCWYLIAIGICFSIMATVQVFGVSGEFSAPDAAIEVDVAYIYRAPEDTKFTFLSDGDTMQSGDYYKVMFMPREQSYIYIFQVDASGAVYCLFPTSDSHSAALQQSNPVQANITYYVPAKDQSFELDDVTGTEKIYFLASRESDRELDVYITMLHQRENPASLSLEELDHIDRVLDELEDALQTKGLAKGWAHVGLHTKNVGPLTWTEQGQTFSIIRQRLEGLCDGCVHVLTFTHQ